MMVTRSPYVENPQQLGKDLDLAAKRLAEISKAEKPSKQEINDLIHLLHRFNEGCDSSFWEEKKLVPEEMRTSIENALAALVVFHRTQPNKKNIEQAITSLFSTLSYALNDFDKNLKNLKDYRIGVKIEKSGPSKQTS